MAKQTKIAVIGAGSFVFGPSVLWDLLAAHRLQDVNLALVDIDADALGAMVDLGKRLALDNQVNARITGHARREEALADADFVIVCIARQPARRFAMDCDVIKRIVPSHIITEFGGVAGTCYSLRQIDLIGGVVDDMLKLCPNAWFLCSANPMPRVVQMAVRRGLKAAGFCSAGLWAHQVIWRLLHDDQRINYPYAEATKALELVAGGVNHLSWAVRLTDRVTGQGLLPKVMERFAAGAVGGEPGTALLALQTRCLTLAGDSHIRDFLEPTPLTTSRASAVHGDPDERKKRLEELRAIGRGELPADRVVAHRSWEKPGSFIAAIVSGEPVGFEALNLPNAGQMPDLPQGAIVETPCVVDDSGPHPELIHLPAGAVDITRRTAEHSLAMVEAIEAGDLPKLESVLRRDPTVRPDERDACVAALRACIEAHADVLPNWARQVAAKP